MSGVRNSCETLSTNRCAGLVELAQAAILPLELLFGVGQGLDRRLALLQNLLPLGRVAPRPAPALPAHVALDQVIVRHRFPRIDGRFFGVQSG